jgi:hypothetical protein
MADRCKYFHTEFPEASLDESDGIDGAPYPTKVVRDADGRLVTEYLDIEAMVLRKARRILRQWPQCKNGGTVSIRACRTSETVVKAVFYCDCHKISR